jgi:mannose-6-phosphate isomerase-like protein (cupin superfamily)
LIISAPIYREAPLIDLEDRTIELNPNQGVTITKGVMHRPRAPKKTVMLMVETDTIQPTGD